jgi:DNA-binding MltR family transcriptional regulator
MESDDGELSEKPYLKALKDHWRSEPTQADLKRLNKDLYRSDSRVAAILLGSLVERSIERLLRTIMRDRSSTGRLFDHQGPFGTFSAKIHGAYALKLIGPKTRHDLDLIREIRNAFAHSRRPLRFSDKAIKDACAHLQYPEIPGTMIGFTALDQASRKQLRAAVDKSNPKTRYTLTCNEIAKRIYWVRGGEGDSDLNELP